MLLLSLLVACSTEPPPDLVFVRGGVVAPAQVAPGGRLLADGRSLHLLEWEPGAEVQLGSTAARAPAIAECLPLFRYDLGDTSRLIAMGGEAPDAALSLSPDGGLLAVGTYLGEVLLLEAWTGERLGRRRLAETMVKAVAWSPDGRTIYAAEQSPDAFLHALDVDGLGSRWKVRLADQVGTSAAPPGEDLYGVYTLPAAYGLVVLDGGDLIVAAVHGWNEDDGRRNLSRLLRLGSDGQILAAWPARAADVTLMHPRVDQEGGLVVVPVGRSAAGPPPDLPIGGVQLLELDDLSERAGIVAEPLLPLFDRAFVWEAVDVDASQDALLMGLGDGRVLVSDLDGELRLRLDLGTPLRAGQVPISTSIGHGHLLGGGLLTITSGTNVPYGSDSAALRPPSAHPHENALWYHGLDGVLRWTWRGPQVLNGMTVRGDTLVVGAGARRADDRTDLFGALVFDLGDDGPGRLQAFCGTEGPVWFRQAVASDGRVYVVEAPHLREDGAVTGRYRVTGFR